MKQHVTPVILQQDRAVRLERVELNGRFYTEEWIQGICFDHPTLLPIDELESSFGGVVSICKELSTPSGSCDLVYLNPLGTITLAECKLWRNPEARRQAVGQLLDYAKDITKWDYSRFEAECLKARKSTETSLHQIVSNYYPEIVEQEFIDQVQTNLQRGRFLLLIVGDGIRENMEDIVSYLQGHGGLSFTLSLIELPVYSKPGSEDLIITPRILARTKEIIRTVIRLDDGGALKEVPAGPKQTSTGQTLTEKDFYERLAMGRNPEISQRLKDFISAVNNEYGIVPRMGRGQKLSLSLKSADDRYNFASIQENGEVWFYGIVTKTGEVGKRQIGIDYLKDLARLVNGRFDDNYSEWYWCVRREGKYLMVDEYLTVSAQWKDLIGRTVEMVQRVEDGG